MRFRRLLFLFAAFATLRGAQAAKAAAPPPIDGRLVPALGWAPEKQGSFATCLVAGAAGAIWVGTEANGLWRYDPHAKSWRQFTTADGLGDNSVYALAIDNQNRLWAGHLNHGVSVFNGAAWKNYGILNGPLGDRVFAITVSPRDGDVWIATDLGLARYSESRHDWDYYTRASGLVSDQIQAIAFDSKGRLYAGTQSSGISIAGPQDDYTHWQTIYGAATPPRVPAGEGLPSNLINWLATFQTPSIPASSVIAALTPHGLATTADGSIWQYTRGRDWRDRTPGMLPAGPDLAQGPLEDWMTNFVAEGAHLWMGYAREGVSEHDWGAPPGPRIHAVIDPASLSPSPIIRGMLVEPDQPPLFASFGRGLLTIAGSPDYSPPASSPLPAAKLPAEAPVPAEADFKALAAQLARFSAQLAPGEAYYLADDWRTQGDWVGRYGGSLAMLFGSGPQGVTVYRLEDGFDATLRGDAIATGTGGHSSFVVYSGSNAGADRRALYFPSAGCRLNGACAAFEHSPGLWLTLSIPQGLTCLSLYFDAGPAHPDADPAADLQDRDYELEIVPADSASPNAGTVTPLAASRVTDFSGGVYKQFMLCGPASYIVRIRPNGSTPPRLQGVFFDHVVDSDEDNRSQLPGFDTAPYHPADPPDNYEPAGLAAAAVSLWSSLDAALPIRGALPLQMPFRVWAYRAALAAHVPDSILESWRWDISIWTPEDRRKFDAAMKAAHAAHGPDKSAPATP